MRTEPGELPDWEAALADGVPARVYHPRSPRWSGRLVWAHGGSWTRGSVAEWHDPCLALAARTGATVVSVDYRLAPTHRCPAGLEDVLRVLEWAGDRGGRVAVGGDSAGATIAAGAALAVRDRGHPLTAQVLAYPPMDPDCRAASYGSKAFPRRSELRAAWSRYLGDHPGPYGVPLRVDDLSGAAPAIVGVGALDPVRDDTVAYAGRLDRAGVPVRLRVFPAMGHAALLRPGPNPLHDWIATELLALDGIPGTTSRRGPSASSQASNTCRPRSASSGPWRWASARRAGTSTPFVASS